MKTISLEMQAAACPDPGCSQLSYRLNASFFVCGALHRSVEDANAPGKLVLWEVSSDDSLNGHNTNGLVSAVVKVDVAAETNLTFRTAREIAESTAEEPDWIVNGWLARGAITELDGKIKSSGKTTLVSHMVSKVLGREPWLGTQTKYTKVVWLSEQSPATFREALRRARLLDHDDLVLLFWHETVGSTWPATVRAAAGECVRIGAELLITDTLGQFAGLTGDAENNAGAAMQAMAPLQAAAALYNLAVLITRHERKGGGDVGESGRGSSAFAGAVDIILSLRRLEGNARPTLREIRSLSRYDETPDQLILELVDGEYVAQGTQNDLAVREARARVLDILPASEAQAQCIKHILELAAGAKRTAVQEALAQLLQLGAVRCIGSGKRNDPKRYWAPAGEEAAGDPAEPMVSAATGGLAAETNALRAMEPPMVSAATSHLSTAETNLRCDRCGELLTGDRQFRCERCTDTVSGELGDGPF